MFNNFFKFKNKLLVIELDERYFDKKSLTGAVVQHLINKGKKCEVIGDSLLLVDGKKYYLLEKNIPVKYGPPVQQSVLVEVIDSD